MATQQQTRAPGPQNPQKYGTPVGPNYLKYGEQPGYVYIPQFDKYYLDPNALKKEYENQGLVKKEEGKSSLTDLVIPAAAVGGVVTLTTEFGKQGTTKFFEWLKSTPAGSDAIKAGGGSVTPTTTPTGTTPQSGFGKNDGLLGVAKPNGTVKETDLLTGDKTSFGGDAAGEAYQVGTADNGGKLMSDGSVIEPDGTVRAPDSATGTNWAGVAQGVGGAAQAYTGYQQIQDGQEIGGAANVIGGGYNMYAGYQAATGGGVPGWGAYVAPAVAAAQIAQQTQNTEGNSDDRAAASQTEAQKSMLVFIPGVGWIAYAAVLAGDALTGGAVTKEWTNLNRNVDKFNDRIDFGLGKAIRSKVFHQSTRGVQKEHTGQLLQQSEDEGWQNYVKGMRAQHQEAPPDPTKPFAGKYATWDEYKAAGLDANDLTGVYGNLDAFKPDWAEKAGLPDWSKLTFEQQRAVTQELINADLYDSEKGEVVVTDKDKAREIYAQMAQSGFGAGTTAPTQAPAAPPQQAAPTNRAPQAQQPQPPQSQPAPVYQGAQPGAVPQGVGRTAEEESMYKAPVSQATSQAVNGAMGRPQGLTPQQQTMLQDPRVQQATQNALSQLGGQQSPAMSIYGQPPAQQQVPPEGIQQSVQNLQPPRSQTRSPGIGLDGRPIQYGPGGQPGAVPPGANGRPQLTPEQQAQLMAMLAARSGGQGQGLFAVGARR